tara:strand:+ start:512 stop:883 length:372 start_codon:yes stop_codon:yes gene_type:complete
MKKILGFILICLVLLFFSLLGSIKNDNTEGYTTNNLINKSHENLHDQIDMLTYSTFHPQCCPSPYSTSHGCLCYDNQEDLAIITRGNNRIYTHNDAYIHEVTRHVDNRKDKPSSTSHNICNKL